MSSILESIYKGFDYIDQKVGPSGRKDAKPACFETREMLMECVLMSDCFKEHNNFRYCIQDGINKECKALRYDYHLCRRSQIFWEKSIREERH